MGSLWFLNSEFTSVALKLLSQPCFSSCYERKWSTFSFIHSLKRNKLTTAQAKDLVYAHNNLRLLSRSSDEYNEEKQECGILTEIALTHFRVPVF